MVLKDKEGNVIIPGHILQKDNELYKVIDIHEPKHSGSSGKVTVKAINKNPKTINMTYFVTVFDLKWTDGLSSVKS